MCLDGGALGKGYLGIQINRVHPLGSMHLLSKDHDKLSFG